MGTTNTALRRVIMHEKQIKLIAYASIIALWLVWLADLAIDIRTMFDDGFWQNMAGLPPWRVEVATFALFLFPFVSGGVYVLNRGLRQPWLCLMLVFLFSTVCIYMHSSYFYFARAAAYHATLSGAEREAVGALLAEYQSFKNIFGAVFLIGVLVVSVWLFAVVAAGENRVSACLRPAQPADGRTAGQNAQSCLSVCRWDAVSRAHPVFLDGFAVYRLSAVFAAIRANEQISGYDTKIAAKRLPEIFSCAETTLRSTFR